MFWLSGQAGTGKSTISRTVAQTFKDREELGASFFFKRGEGDCGTAARFFSTITRQLLKRVPEIIPDVSAVIKGDPGISERSFKDQFEKLLLKPLCGLDLGPHKVVRVVVLDALDECHGDNNIKLLLGLLPKMQGVNISANQDFLDKQARITNSRWLSADCRRCSSRFSTPPDR